MSVITWHDIQELSINLPEFTQFVQPMNWQNTSCNYVEKIAQSISKRIACNCLFLKIRSNYWNVYFFLATVMAPYAARHGKGWKIVCFTGKLFFKNHPSCIFQSNWIIHTHVRPILTIFFKLINFRQGEEKRSKGTTHHLTQK